MSKLVAALPLIGFFLALAAYWCWQRAKEAATDADLQARLWQHSKYQRDYDAQAGPTPLEVSQQMTRQRSLFLGLAAALALCALGCFGGLALHLAGQ